MNTPVLIYTDGSCKGNPGPGGWGAYMSRNGKEKSLYGGEPLTTNNRMELMAAIKALEALSRPQEVHVIADSGYLVEGMSKYLSAWKAKGWRKTDGKQVLNADLWQRLDELSGIHRISWQWVKGHSGNLGNEKADALAKRGVEESWA